MNGGQREKNILQVPVLFTQRKATTCLFTTICIRALRVDGGYFYA